MKMKGEEMTSKERLEMALNHKEPDRVPFDLNGTETSGISIIALKNWLELNGIRKSPLKFFNLICQLGLMEEDILQRFKVDTRCLRTNPPSNFELKLEEEGDHRILHDEWGIKWKMPIQHGLYYDLAINPLASFTSPGEVDEYPWPDPHDSSRYENLKAEAEHIEATSQAGIVLERNTGGIFETSWWMRGFENFLMDLAANPSMACAIMDKVLEFKMAYWEEALQRVKDDVLVMAEADDLGAQSGLLFSREMYRKYLKPRHKKLFSFMKKMAPDVKLFYHSCGAIYDAIPDLIEVGVEILNPIQVSAHNMDTKKLKKEFGKDLVFWGGGVDTQKILPYGTEQEVRDEVKRRIDDLAPGGGFVFAPVHCIQQDVPPENIQAMWETVQDYGKY
jgi:uroporphyrinogen decarboxylase